MRTPSVEQPVRFLSGGNQQKVSLTRPFLRDVHVIIADEPTQGVDVRSRFDIYEAFRVKADDGVGMIIKSSDPLELAGLCDRVVVISRGRIIDEIAGDDLTERRIIEAIVRSRHRAPSDPAQQAGGRVATEPAPETATVPRKGRTMPGWFPLVLMTLLMFAIGGYAAGRNSAFYSDFNLNTLFGPSGALPLVLVAMRQANALMVGSFDISVGALMTLVVCVGSYILTPDSSWYELLLASIGLVALGVAAGVINAFLIRKLRLPSIIATLATLGVTLGIALRLRPEPGGEINSNFADTLSSSWSWMPFASIAAAVLGGASLGGGRGSFVGGVVGGLFLALIVNVLALENIVPAFLRAWSDALPLISIGALTLVALVLYQAPELWTRARTIWQEGRLARSRIEPTA